MNKLLRISKRLSSCYNPLFPKQSFLSIYGNTKRNAVETSYRVYDYYSTYKKNMAYNVVHNKDAKEFVIVIQNDNGEEEKAMLQYDFVNPNLVDLFHTEVPPVFRGKGIAKILAKEAIDHFIKEDMNMRLSCTYLQKYVTDNPKPEYSKDRISF